MPQYGSPVPERAFDTCKRASAFVVRDALRRGQEARWVQLCGSPHFPDPVDQWHSVEPAFRIHYVAWIDGEYVDYTARQFDPKAPYPLVGSTHEWDAEYDVTDALDAYLTMV